MKTIALEFKHKKISRNDLHAIVVNALRHYETLRNNGCVIIKCKKAAKTAYDAIEFWRREGVEVHIDECF